MSTIKADNIATLAGVSTSMANAVNGSAKAWVNFNGTGTVAIRASYNVSSITDNGSGDYTVNFTNAMPDANYSYSGGTHNNAGSGFGLIIANNSVTTSFSSGSLRFRTGDTGSFYDVAFVTVSIFR